MGEPKLFLNSPGTLVVEAIEGTLACEQHLAAMQQVGRPLPQRASGCQTAWETPSNVLHLHKQLA